jgi:hypothetical protein
LATAVLDTPTPSFFSPTTMRGPIGPGEADGGLAAQNGQLVAQHENLSVIGHVIQPMNEEQLGDAPEEPVEEGQCHERRASPSASLLVKSAHGIIALSRVSPGTFRLLRTEMWRLLRSLVSRADFQAHLWERIR